MARGGEATATPVPRGTIQVAVRVRPLVTRELAEGALTALEVDEGNGCVTANGVGHSQARRFTFDHVFGPTSEPVRYRAPCKRPGVDGGEGPPSGWAGRVIQTYAQRGDMGRLPWGSLCPSDVTLT